jgi:hypothetical protein
VIEKLLHSEVSSDDLRSYPRFTQTEIRPLQPDFCYASPSIIEAEFFPRSKAATIPWVWDFAASALRPMKHAKIKGSNYTSGSRNLLLHRSSGVFFIHEEINCIYSK